MIAVAIVGVCAIFSACFCLIGIGLSLDHIGDMLERIDYHIRKGGE